MSFNAIFFTVKTNQKNTDYYCMLMTALDSLFSSTPNLRHDVFVYCDLEDLHPSEININGRNIANSFPSVNIIYKSWPESKNYRPVPSPNYFYKWLCLEHIIHNTRYKNLAYFDCDVYFLKNINNIFDCYPKNFCGIYEGYCELKNKLIGTPHAMCSGQFVFERELLLHIPNIFQKIIEKSEYLCDNIDRILDNHRHCAWFKALMEQYAGHKILLDYNVNITPMNTKDISFGAGTCDIDIVNKDINIVNSMTRIIHYTRKNAPLFVKSKYRNEKLSKEFDELVVNNKLIRNLWG